MPETDRDWFSDQRVKRAKEKDSKRGTKDERTYKKRKGRQGKEHKCEIHGETECIGCMERPATALILSRQKLRQPTIPERKAIT